jgi:hypothetical protein
MILITNIDAIIIGLSISFICNQYLFIIELCTYLYFESHDQFIFFYYPLSTIFLRNLSACIERWRELMREIWEGKREIGRAKMAAVNYQRRNNQHICSPIYLGKIKPLWKLYSSLVEREWSWFVYESLVMWYCYRWL